MHWLINAFLGAGIVLIVAAPLPAHSQQRSPTNPAAPTHTATPPAAPSTRAPATDNTGRFDTEAAAKARCPSDTVVWVNLKSKIYHFSGHADYGHTKSGTFMCEKDAMAGGSRAAKNEKHP